MISRQLQPEVSLHRSADVRRPGGIDAPSAVFILMAQNPVRRLLKPLLIARPEQRVQQNVIRLEGGVGFEFAAPVSFFMLLREKIFPRRSDRRATRLPSPSIFPKRSCGLRPRL